MDEKPLTEVMAEVIRSLLRMVPHHGRDAEFVRRFTQLDVLGAAARTAGLRTGELLRPNGGGSYVVTATWDGLEAYQVWRDSTVRQELGAELDGLVVPGVSPDIYEVILVHPSARRRSPR